MSTHLIITGRVQGVGYRDWLVGEARALGLAGWVRNRADGSVEAVVGDGAEALTARAWRGPALARVDDVAASAIETEDLPLPFERRATA